MATNATALVALHDSDVSPIAEDADEYLTRVSARTGVERLKLQLERTDSPQERLRQRARGQARAQSIEALARASREGKVQAIVRAILLHHALQSFSGSG